MHFYALFYKMRPFDKKHEKPCGLPDNWPYSSENDLNKMKNRIIRVGLEQMYSFKDNSVRTSKYNIWNFLPKFLMEEFNPKTKIANVYFLLICGLQLIPTISNTGGIPTTMVPLFFIVCIDGIFAAIEDFARYKADKAANSSLTMRLQTDRSESESEPMFVNVEWANVKVGDIIKVKSRECVPSDILLIDVAPTVGISDGVCFIETKSLDGETNLKTRQTINIDKQKVIQQNDSGLWYNHLKGNIEMEHPNSLIDEFSGVFETYFQRDKTRDHTNAVARRITKGAAMEVINEVLSDDEETFDGSPHQSPVNKNSNNKIPIQPNNVLLRGCILRNNDWLVGIVLNTGHDTKVMMTTASSAAKLSFVEILASSAIKYIIIFLLGLGFIASTGQIIWDAEVKVELLWYLAWEIKPGGETFLIWVISNFYYLLLHSSIIPVSLYVSMTFARFIQSYFMTQDLEMFNDNNVINVNSKGKMIKVLNPNEQSCIVKTMTLNEELGHVSHIFSDKTGTLTSNIMEFRKMSIGGVAYGKGITDIGRASWKLQGKSIPSHVLLDEKIAKINSIPNVVFYCDRYNNDISSLNVNDISKTNIKGGENVKLEHAKKIDFFFRMLALCHDAIREADQSSSDSVDQSGNVKLSASNPDDQALISAAEHFGYAFYKREENGVVIIRERINKSLNFVQLGDQQDENIIFTSKSWMTDESKYIEYKYRIAQSITFSSKRKRMSVIVESLNPGEENQYTLYCKGAETVIYDRLDKSNNRDMIKTTDEHLQQFSSEGLRCLLLAYKLINKSDYLDWEANYKKQKSSLSQIENKKNGLPNQIEMLEDEMENGMFLLGATGIEDRLQDGVPDCIATLLEAGLNIWVLTGDKEETAINIAVACNLIAASDKEMRRIVINRSTCPTLGDACAMMTYEINLCKKERESGEKSLPRSLVIDGSSLISLFMDKNERLDLHLQSSNMIVSKKSKKRFSFMDQIREGHSFSSMKNSFSSVTPISENLSSKSSPDSKPEEIKPEDIAQPRDIFIELAMLCRSVICCRVSPDQKREIVSIIRKKYPLISTLAIGDGANDVAMIKEAHIGVGIKGEEGVQAVNAADYAFSQFRFLIPLLLKHGRYNYIRLTNLICFVFYKNILMTMGLFWFNIYCGYSGQKIYTESAIQLYNLFFTSLPIILYASYDMDINVSSVYRFPKVYSTGKENKCFDTASLMFYICNAIVDSAIIVFVSFVLMAKSGGSYVSNDLPGQGYSPFGDEDPTGSRGMLGSFWDVGAAIYTSIVIIVNLKLFFFQSNWTILHYVILVIGVLAWIAIAFGVSYYMSLDYEWYNLFFKLVTDRVFWATVVFSVVTISLKDTAMLIIKKEYFLSQEEYIQELQYQEANNKGDAAKVSPSVASDSSTLEIEKSALAGP